MLKKVKKEMMKGTALANTLANSASSDEPSIISPRPASQRPHVPKIFGHFGKTQEHGERGGDGEGQVGVEEPDIFVVYSNFADENRDRLSQVISLRLYIFAHTLFSLFHLFLIFSIISSDTQAHAKVREACPPGGHGTAKGWRGTLITHPHTHTRTHVHTHTCTHTYTRTHMSRSRLVPSISHYTFDFMSHLTSHNIYVVIPRDISYIPYHTWHFTPGPHPMRLASHPHTFYLSHNVLLHTHVARFVPHLMVHTSYPSLRVRTTFPTSV